MMILRSIGRIKAVVGFVKKAIMTQTVSQHLKKAGLSDPFHGLWRFFSFRHCGRSIILFRALSENAVILLYPTVNGCSGYMQLPACSRNAFPFEHADSVLFEIHAVPCHCVHPCPSVWPACQLSEATSLSIGHLNPKSLRLILQPGCPSFQNTMPSIA